MGMKSTGGKTSHTRHDDEYKQERLKLAAQVGIAKAVSEWESGLAAENARLKSQLAQ